MKVVFIVLFLTVRSSLSFNNTAFDYHMRLGVSKATYLRLLESQRIVGGTQAGLGDLAFQAGILITLTSGWPSVCSGSLVSSTRVLTAAHCWFDGISQAAMFTVVLGSVALYSGGTRVQTTDVVMHPSWSPNGLTFDVAMVKFGAIGFNNNIYPLPLPVAADATLDFAGRTGTASGYGRVSDAANLTPLSSNLYRVELSIISNLECSRSFDGVHGSHICTSGTEGRGTCEGDAGGPLTVLHDNQRVLVGIASFDLMPLCESGQPSVFSRVTAFLPWIWANM